MRMQDAWVKHDQQQGQNLTSLPIAHTTLKVRLSGDGDAMSPRFHSEEQRV